MKVLVVGGGGREHCLVWKIKQSKYVKEIFCAPGNGGILQDAKCIDIKPTDLEGLVRFAYNNRIDLTLVGPEAPLVEGIVDIFQKEKLNIFGPNKLASQLEASKSFCKEMLKRWSVPVPSFKVFDDYYKAKKYIEEKGAPIVVKADGLCAGKGVFVCSSKEEALEALDKIMKEKIFKEAGNKVVIEEFLEGEEASILGISDGKNILCFASSQDHKRVFDEDKGPNTGGMGAYSPAPLITPPLFERIEEEIMRRAIQGMYKDVCPFRGVLYAGLMIVEDQPYVLEFNIRFGDPETQAILPRLNNDLLELVISSIEGDLNMKYLSWKQESCICVVLASGGYPGTYQKGFVIRGIDDLKSNLNKDIIIFHAGTEFRDGKFFTNSGRVLNVCALDKDFKKAFEKVYRAIENIYFENMHYRKDIGVKAFKRES